MAASTASGSGPKARLLRHAWVSRYVESGTYAEHRKFLHERATSIRRVRHLRRSYLGLSPIVSGHHEFQYRGVVTRKSPFDLVLYQMIVNELRPDLVIEIGTNFGGSAYYLADLMTLLGKGRVHTIDIKDYGVPEEVRNHQRIDFFLDGWDGYSVEWARDFDTVMVIDDGSHSYSDVLGALRKFSPLVSDGSLYIVEDGVLTYLGLDREYQGGPLHALREFLPGQREFVVDRTLCDFWGRNATFNPEGYLRRLPADPRTAP